MLFLSSDCSLRLVHLHTYFSILFLRFLWSLYKTNFFWKRSKSNILCILYIEGQKQIPVLFLFCFFFNGIQNTVRIIKSGKYILLLRGGKVWNPDPCACWASDVPLKYSLNPRLRCFGKIFT